MLIVLVLFLADRPHDPAIQDARPPNSRRRQRRRSSVLVGVSLSRVWDRHRQRAARPGQRPRASDAHLSQAVSADTDHSFWVPRLGRKDRPDSEPCEQRCGSTRTEPGLYLGQCAQYCGTQHAKMLLRVVRGTRPTTSTPGSRAAAASRRARTTQSAEGATIFETHHLHELSCRSSALRRPGASVRTSPI